MEQDCDQDSKVEGGEDQLRVESMFSMDKVLSSIPSTSIQKEKRKKKIKEITYGKTPG